MSPAAEGLMEVAVGRSRESNSQSSCQTDVSNTRGLAAGQGRARNWTSVRWATSMVKGTQCTRISAGRQVRKACQNKIDGRSSSSGGMSPFILSISYQHVTNHQGQGHEKLGPLDVTEVVHLDESALQDHVWVLSR